MTTVNVSASKNYNVYIGRDLSLSENGINEKADCKIALISDDTVMALYGEATKAKLEAVGYKVVSYTFPHGEPSKNIKELGKILEFLAENNFTRTDKIAALGGGVTGDMAGFAASIFLRGIEFIQIPTTLLAAVDSSVGGKTAIDLEAGKNLAGAFWQPEAVFCDLDTFKTLEPAIFADGMAEAIKYGAMWDIELFEKFEAGIEENDYEEMVAACVAIKRDVVEADERDTGVRQLLNFGHTFAHGIEKCSGYTITHGHAVAIGMVIAAEIAEKTGFSKEPCKDRISKVLKKYNLPVSTDIPMDDLLAVAMKDKKRKGNSITLVLPEKLGKCLLKTVEISELEAMVK
ncbi:MAG: 3-dehydroquinate synthase [Ruminococcaceae bacterium]|nr:3-dehydroquinate synthase [Oscillospiraceae bacterium]